MKILKILFRILIGIFILLFIFLGVIYLMKDTIIAKTVEHIEVGYDIDVDYHDISLSFFRSFPDIGLDVEELRVKNKNDSISWADIQAVNIDLDIMSVLRPSGAMKVNGVHFDKAIILYEIYEDSTSNIDAFLSPADTSQSSSENLEIALNSYSISHGNIIYLDHTTGTNINLAGLNHMGKGNLTATEYKLNTETSLDSFSAMIDNVSYASNLKIVADADILVNTETNLYRLEDALLSINDFKTSLSGKVILEENHINTDIEITQANSGITELMSLIPSSFKGDYADIKADGSLQMNGKIKGDYKYGLDFYPALDLNLEVNNATIQYPDLPEKLSALNLNAKLTKKEGSLDYIVLNVNPFSVNVGSASHLKGNALLSQVMSNLHAVGMINGDLDLNALANSYPIPDVNSMSGQTEFNLDFNAKLDDIQNENYEDIGFDGNAIMKTVKIDYEGYPSISINNATTDISHEQIELADLDMMIGRSDFQGNMAIAEPLNFLTDEKKMNISLNGESKFIDVAEFSDSDSQSSASQTALEQPTTDYSIINRINADIKCNIDELSYPPYTLSNIQVDSRLRDGSINVDNTRFVYEKSNFKIDGNVSQISQYLSNTAPLGGTINIETSEFDLYKYMQKSAVEETQNPTASVEDFVLPKMINLELKAQVEKVQYDNIEMKNLKADLNMAENQKLFITNSSANIMGGSMSLDGVFEAQDEQKPYYNFNYQINRVNIPKAARDIQLVGKLAPVTEFMQGFFNTSLTLSGNLTKELGIDLNSLSLKGVFETIDASISNFKPLTEIGEKLNVNSFKNIKIQNSKNWLEVADGDVIVRPFDIKLGEVDATVSGTHTLSGSQLNYTLETIIPREWLAKSELTKSVDKGISWLEGEAGKRGLDLDAGDQFYVDILINGTITAPKVQLKLKDVTGKSVADAAKDKLKEKRKEAEDSIRNSINREKQELEKQANARADSIRRAAEEEAKRRAKEILTGGSQNSDSETKKEIDKAAEEAKKKLDEARKRLKKLNPFGD